MGVAALSHGTHMALASLRRHFPHESAVLSQDKRCAVQPRRTLLTRTHDVFLYSCTQIDEVLKANPQWNAEIEADLKKDKWEP